VWIKRAKERFASYLMAHGVGEQNVDQVIEFAKGGFGCIEIYPWLSTPSYKLNPKLFPNGMKGLKTVADKIHAAGLQLGLHTMQGMVGWGGMRDPYITPKADPRLLQDRHATLATELGPKDTEVKVSEATTDWPEKGDLYIEGEIVRYERRTEAGFAECTRGMHGTTIATHPKGAQVGNLVNCFKMWGHCIYAPDVRTPMIDEVCENIARVFNAVGADMTYFDGGEELCVQPPHWRNVRLVGMGVMKRLKKAVVLEGNAVYTHLSWHVVTRGSPHFDPIYFGRREYTLRFKGQNPASWKKNLLTGDVGWFTPHVHSPSTYAVTPDEVMLLCLKALGGKSPISFSVNCNNLYANKRMPEMLEIIRTCDELKRLDYFSEKICAELTKPMAEHVLERRAESEWVVRPMQFGPPRVVRAQQPADEWAYKNPYSEQTPWLRLRAQTRLAPYGAKDNIVLADFQGTVPFAPDGTASAEVEQSVASSTEKTPDGASAFCYRAYNKGKARSGWARLSFAFPKTINLTENRRLGVWVRGEGKGGILNVQLVQGYGAKDHYIPLDFKGWVYCVLDPPEDVRFYDYRWPYSFIDLMYWVFQYGSVKGVNLFYNDLPPATEVSCLIGRVVALRELPVSLKSPALEVGGRKLVFPVSLKPDEYLELDWAGKCRHFEANGGLIAEVKPEGSLRLAPGENRVRFSCETGESASDRAEVTLAVRGEVLQDERKLHPQGGLPIKREGEKAEGFRLVPDGKGGFRAMQGLYELVGRETVQAISAFDGVGNVWSVENPTGSPWKAAVAIARGGTGEDADYDDPKGLLLEGFDDLRDYEMSQTNQFEKYVIGGEKQLTKYGPVRAGVTQTFVASREGARAGGSCGVYAATNEGGAGGWCAKGKRFPQVLDLSGFEALAMWIHGDGKKEILRFQFRDEAGKNADWLVPIDFTGWRFMVFKTSDAKEFNWRKTEYVIFYYNGIPANTSVTMKFDDLKALPKLRKAPPISRITLTVNERRIRLPVELKGNECLTTDGNGGLTIWRADMKPAKRLAAPETAIELKPGANRVELSCECKGVPRDVTVRVIRLGPIQE
jgi:hypothetical protein